MEKKRGQKKLYLSRFAGDANLSPPRLPCAGRNLRQVWDFFFLSFLFPKKRKRGRGAAPRVASRRTRNAYGVKKRRRGSQNVPAGRFDRGNPRRGFPRVHRIFRFFPLLFFHKSPRIIHIARCFYFFPELFHSRGKRWKKSEFSVNPGAAFPQGTVNGDSGGQRHPRRFFPKTFHVISSFSPVSVQTLSNNRRA